MSNLLLCGAESRNSALDRDVWGPRFANNVTLRCVDVAEFVGHASSFSSFSGGVM